MSATTDRGQRYSYDEAFAQIKTVVTIKPHAWSCLVLRVLGLSTDLSSLMLPVHDPPVAWQVADHPYAKLGISVIACPGMATGQVRVLAPGGYMDPAPIVLDEEPGRRP